MLRAVDELVLAPIWRLAMDPTGNTACTIQFHDGTCVEADANLAIFNRIGWSTSPAFRDASETDAAYAAMETHALLLSWLAAHPGPVLNPPQANGLSGLRASRLGWRVLAMRTGLPVCPWFVTSSAREFPPPPGLRPTLAPDRFIDPLVAIAGDRFAEFDAAGPDAARTTALVVGDRVVASLPESRTNRIAWLSPGLPPRLCCRWSSSGLVNTGASIRRIRCHRSRVNSRSPRSRRSLKMRSARRDFVGWHSL